MNNTEHMRITRTGHDLIHHHYDQNGNLHFCLIATLSEKEYFVDIDHCGEYDHDHTRVILKVFKSKPAEATIVRFPSCRIDLFREIISGCIQEIRNNH